MHSETSDDYMGDFPSDDFTGNSQTYVCLQMIIRNASFTDSYQYHLLRVVISIKFDGPRPVSKQARVAAAFSENAWPKNNI